MPRARSGHQRLSRSASAFTRARVPRACAVRVPDPPAARALPKGSALGSRRPRRGVGARSIVRARSWSDAGVRSGPDSRYIRKGTARDMAERIDAQSGRSQPAWHGPKPYIGSGTAFPAGLHAARRVVARSYERCRQASKRRTPGAAGRGSLRQPAARRMAAVADEPPLDAGQRTTPPGEPDGTSAYAMAGRELPTPADERERPTR